jgi:hypothetical protein
MKGVRRFVPAWVVTCLVWALVQAPFDHTHDHDPDHEHAEGLAHTHAPGGHSHDTGWEAAEPGSDARAKDWQIAPGKSPVVLQALPPDAVRIPLLASQAINLPPPAPCNHDPPSRRNLRPRAPPPPSA